MRTPTQSIVVAIALAGALLSPSLSRSEENPGCISWSPRVRYQGIGYDHVVDINNRCDKAASCRVRTDVTPEWQTVQVPSRSTVEVVTFLVSPSREFKAQVECKL